MAAEEGQVVGIHTVDAWTELLQKGNDTKKLAMPTFMFVKEGKIVDKVAGGKASSFFFCLIYQVMSLYYAFQRPQSL